MAKRTYYSNDLYRNIYCYHRNSYVTHKTLREDLLAGHELQFIEQKRGKPKSDATPKWIHKMAVKFFKDISSQWDHQRIVEEIKRLAVISNS